MSLNPKRCTLLLVTAVALGAEAAAPAIAPCDVLSPESWGSIMGYSATATAGEGNCTYTGAKKSGAGQLRILAVAASASEAEASVKRMRARPSKGSHDANLSVIDSQGPVVFSISLFEPASTESTAAQLQKLVAATKQHLPK